MIHGHQSEPGRAATWEGYTQLLQRPPESCEKLVIFLNFCSNNFQ